MWRGRWGIDSDNSGSRRCSCAGHCLRPSGYACRPCPSIIHILPVQKTGIYLHKYITKPSLRPTNMHTCRHIIFKYSGIDILIEFVRMIWRIDNVHGWLKIKSFFQQHFTHSFDNVRQLIHHVGTVMVASL